MTIHKRMLVINGGGVRGIIPAKIIKKLVDESNGKQINELFDYIIGTSIGGIIATALTVVDEDRNLRYSPTDVVDIVANEAKNIFPQNTISHFPVIGNIYQAFFPKYNREGIDSVLNEKLGNATFKDTAIPITTVSYSLDNDSPRVWSTFKAIRDDLHNHYLKDAAGATSAAPTYFAPKVTKTKNGETYHDIDGGIYANSPTVLGVSWLLSANPGLTIQDIVIVSIGTGRFEDTPISHKDAPVSTALETPGISLATALALCVGSTFLSYSLAVPLCFISSMVGAALELSIAANNFGQIGWVAKHGIIDKMMKGAEMSDAIASTLMLKTIRINLEFDKQFSPMDNSNSDHINGFIKAIDRKINSEGSLWSKIVECLNSKDFNSTNCNEARYKAEHFNEAFRYQGFEKLIGQLQDFEVE